ncbi:MAG: hypothetical protein UX28_C0001G0097 [Candidatus Pacebacteria bacterium GW2011_GWA1_46_10]|nr:MAG: hypothetical protein UX28_C0001G0097 [Candidatus Pacebacteria bacterium GW2011_GWA1_46_10]
MKNLEPIPRFKSYQEEVSFWRKHNLNDYVKFNQSSKILYSKNLKQRVTVRFPIEDFSLLRKIANQRKIGIATFIRQQILLLLDKHRDQIFEKAHTKKTPSRE